MLSDRERRHYLRDLARRHSLQLFIETGTSEGDTTDVMLAVVDRVITIEVRADKYKQCVRRFINRPLVTLVHGDSDEYLEQIVQEVKEPALFWLDAHLNSPEEGPVVTPIERELIHILEHRPGPVNYVLVDDARLFGGNGYPSLESIKKLVECYGHDEYSFDVHDDIIHILPR